ncbi:hypothetical protein DL766_002779 [Monosporascus sp. MC13-8B]|uniref:Rhodopsin domain-containing protein n=1 Tax=Monosporascus cannonballus TaxID=155416 RepID=A0ABY0HIS2_9PEZI|nr:hypothetical protein DL762_000527 [Monosporascus cannonballus]RYP34881.1 hypothetical protein DL766_002779 [Monosporascus sp. MC13-8B]
MPSMLNHLTSEIGARQSPPGEPTADRPDKVGMILGLCVFSIVMATGPVIARLIFRRASNLRWLNDDYTIIIAALISNANAASYLACLRYGFGKPMETLHPGDIVNFFRLAFITFLIYGASVSFIKFSVLAFYDRIFPRNNFKKWRIVLAVCSVIWWILITFVTIFQCNPIRKAWEFELPGECHPYLYLFIAIQVLNIVLDCAILVLPISAVMKLQMSRANKIGVAGIFALGGLSIIFAIIRLAILIKDRDQTDITYDIRTANWSLIEPSFEIFCACLPCMTPLLAAGRKIAQMSSNWSSSFLSNSKRTTDSSSS